jgi:hypothetical protein
MAMPPLPRANRPHGIRPRGPLRSVRFPPGSTLEQILLAGLRDAAGGLGYWLHHTSGQASENRQSRAIGDSPPKGEERCATALFGAGRLPATGGGALDSESSRYDSGCRDAEPNRHAWPDDAGCGTAPAPEPPGPLLRRAGVSRKPLSHGEEPRDNPGVRNPYAVLDAFLTEHRLCRPGLDDPDVGPTLVA